MNADMILKILTGFFFKSFRAVMSSGASEGTLVTTPVPYKEPSRSTDQYIVRY